MFLSASNVHYILKIQTNSRVGWQFRWQSNGCLGESAAVGISLAKRWQDRWQTLALMWQVWPLLLLDDVGPRGRRSHLAALPALLSAAAAPPAG